MDITERIADICTLLVECIDKASKGEDFSLDWEDVHERLDILKSHLYELKDEGPAQYMSNESRRMANWIKDSLARKAEEARKAAENQASK